MNTIKLISLLQLKQIEMEVLESEGLMYRTLFIQQYLKIKRIPRRHLNPHSMSCQTSKQTIVCSYCCIAGQKESEMSKPPQRDILKMIFTNFVNSLKPRQMRGTYIGEDYFGNKYYEIPANPSVGKRRRERWFEPAGDKEDFQREITAEWEAWLRGRREDPPTRDELVKNLAIMQIKKKNAMELEDKFGKPKDEKQLPKEAKGAASYPKYDEYETVPGRGPKKRE